VDAGGQDLYKRSNEEAKRILREHEVIPKSSKVLKEIDAVLYTL
jgi:trimethylamine:corrinoid methyltransferase-like protein